MAQQKLGAGSCLVPSTSPSATGSPPARRWPAVVGIVVLLANEFFWPDVFLPYHPALTQVWAAVAAEWVGLAVLLLIWLPRVEHVGLSSLGVNRFRWSYLALGLGAYVATFAALFAVQLIQQGLGQETIRSLQPILATYPWPLLVALFLTGTFLEEII